LNNTGSSCLVTLSESNELRSKLSFKNNASSFQIVSSTRQSRSTINRKKERRTYWKLLYKHWKVAMAGPRRGEGDRFEKRKIGFQRGSPPKGDHTTFGILGIKMPRLVRASLLRYLDLQQPCLFVNQHSPTRFFHRDGCLSAPANPIEKHGSVVQSERVPSLQNYCQLSIQLPRNYMAPG
jgi:hypothetical protein